MPAPPPAPSSAPRRNLELKVRVSPKTLEHLRALASSIADGPSEQQHQDDRYFRVPEGRLKLRAITDDTGVSRAELIAYRRPDAAGSRWSAYRIAQLEAGQAQDLAETLGHVLRPLARVRKRREVLLHGATRIPLDQVEGLGAFVELETVVMHQNATSAEQEHRRVIAALGLDAASRGRLLQRPARIR
ncbi:MAG TPA: class IV adenylate cyclase [Thermomicrobiales bacterium]|nr:class IV adenylate cyclase [Thermomicrobiales bacterium]